jgi:hypothetical protein
VSNVDEVVRAVRHRVADELCHRLRPVGCRRGRRSCRCRLYTQGRTTKIEQGISRRRDTTHVRSCVISTTCGTVTWIG